MSTKRPLEPKPWSTCTRCKQEFFTLDRAQDHFEKSCPDLWCDLCLESFDDPNYTRQHMVIHRGRPQLCPRCGYDAGMMGGNLIKHWMETGCHQSCSACKVWFYRESYDVHLELNPYCRRVTYGKGFTHPSQPAGRSEPQAPYMPQVYKGAEIKREDGMEMKHARSNPQNLGEQAAVPSLSAVSHTNSKQMCLYKPAHPVRMQCYGCDKLHPYPASMLNHLESGNCPSMIDILDINYTFAIYTGSERLLPSDGRKSLGSFLSYEDIREMRPFRCCGNGCKASFSVLSGLVQHADSVGCSSNCKTKEILDHLRTNLYYQSFIRKLQKMASTSPATMFVRPPPYQIYQDFLRIPEQWRSESSKLISYVLSAVSNVSCGQPNHEGRNFITFKKPREMGTILDNIESLVTQIRGDLKKIEPGKKRNDGNGPCQILVYFKNTSKAYGLARFLDDVEKFGNVLRQELPEPAQIRVY
ncbi:hypothetical protein TWF281_000622 [Arthrobotrys megalospora]